MTAADRASAARLLEQVAARLESAPGITSDNAERYVGSGNPGAAAAHQAGALEQICRQEAAAVRHIIAVYCAQAPARGAARRRR